MESCGMTAIKYLLFLFNAIFAILGILIIVAASIDISYVKEYSNMGDVSGIETDIILIVIGILIVLIAAFGCFGAIKESTKLLYLFAGCLILIIILELSVAIAAAALRPQMETTVKKHLRESFIKHKAASPGHQGFWNNLQKNLGCCGVIGPEDYNEVTNNVPVPPASCCPGNNGGGDAPSANQALANEQARRSECVVQRAYYMVGCEDKILETIHGAGIGVIVTGIVFCFIEVVGIVLAIMLAQAIKRDGKTETESGRTSRAG